MEDSVLAEVNVRPLKIPKYHGAFEGSSKSVNKKRDLKYRKLGDDEYLRQYLQFYYQFQKPGVKNHPYIHLTILISYES